MSDYKRSVLASARKAQTHLANVIRMLEEDAYCIDVLQQALAVQGLWKGVIRKTFEHHLQTCFAGKVSGAARERDKAITELARVMELAERS